MIPINPIQDRIQIVTGVCGGKPLIRGFRFTVAQMLELLASGMTHSEILEDYPFLEEADIQACLLYATKLVSHQQVALA